MVNADFALGISTGDLSEHFSKSPGLAQLGEADDVIVAGGVAFWGLFLGIFFVFGLTNRPI